VATSKDLFRDDSWLKIITRKANMEKMPSQEYLLRCFEYDFVTGSLHWRNRPLHHFKDSRAHAIWNTRWSNKVALACIGKNGYKHGSLNGKRVYAHRIVYKLLNGTEPDVVDHNDGNKLNNSVDNLNNGSTSDNMKNAKKPINNTSGVVGVCWNVTNKKWHAQIGDNGAKSLGHFDDFEEAVAVRKKAEIKLGFHVNHGRDE
jgi:hypothetical protein